MRVYQIKRGINLIDLEPPIPGFTASLGTYVIRDRGIALIDPGPSASVNNLLSGLEALHIRPESVNYIVCTHIHLDHSGGLGSILKLLPSARAIVHEKAVPHLIDPARLWAGSRQVLGQLALDYGQPEPVPAERLTVAREGGLIDLGNFKLEVVLTPGHAPHHLSLLDKSLGILFVGEAAGAYFQDIQLILPSTPPPFDLASAISSLDKLMAWQPREICYAHFGSAADAVVRMKQYQKMLIEYGRLILRQADKDRVFVFNEILRTTSLQETLSHLPPDRRQTCLSLLQNSVAGFLDYFQRSGTGIITRYDH